MDKHELIEILRSAADGIAGRSQSKEAELKLDSFRRIVYNFCKAAVMDSLDEIPASPDFLYRANGANGANDLDKLLYKMTKFDKLVASKSFSSTDTERRAKELYKQLTNEDFPSKEE